MTDVQARQIEVAKQDVTSDNSIPDLKLGLEAVSSSFAIVSEGIRIRHGTLLADQLAIPDEVIIDFVYDFETRHQVLLYSGGRINVYRNNPARRRHLLSSNEPQYLIDAYQTLPNIKSLLYITRYGFFAGITKTHLHLLDEQFQNTLDLESPKTLSGAVYNDCSGEIVTFGPGYILTWLFRKAGKTISPRAPITEGLSASDQILTVHFEQVPGKTQRCFSVVGTGVRVHYLMSGELVASLHRLHTSPITCIYYFRPLWYLVTGAKDGTICIWNSAWNLVASFVGHLGPVTTLSPYPYGPYIMSSSLDTTIRVWNLESMDEAERLAHTAPVLQVCSVPEQTTFLSRSSQEIFRWTVQHVMKDFTHLWSTPQHLTITSHPGFPRRVVACCEDSTVRLISPVQGHVVATALLPVGVAVEGVVSLPARHLLLLSCSDGLLHVYNTASNPCSLAQQWRRQDLGGCTCLGLFESVMDEESIQQAISRDKWLSVALEANEMVPLYKKKTLESFFPSAVLVLVGTRDGGFGVLDTERGTLDHLVRSHSSPLLSITCLENTNWVVTTATEDHEISLWEVHPHAREGLLSELMRFGSDGVPALVCRTASRLCVAVNDHPSVTYSITMYDMRSRDRYSQCTSMAHTSTITALHCIDKLGLFVSGSEDCTVRIWDQDNHPVRIIQMATPPEGVVFSSLQGDIVLGNLGHLHRIPYSSYLSTVYQTLVVALSLPKFPLEEELPVAAEQLSPQDQDRIFKIRKKPSQYTYKGGLSEEEQLLMKQAASDKARCVNLLKEREEELRKIRDGDFPVVKRRHGDLKGKGRKEMWKELMSLILPFKRIQLKFPEDPAVGQESPDSPYKKGPRRSFFPPLSSLDPPYPVAPDGLLPNSVLLQRLRKNPADRDLASEWVSGELSTEDIAALAARSRPVAEMEEEEEEEDNAFLRKMKDVLDKDYVETPEQFTPTPSPTPPPTPPPPVRTQMRVEKHITKPPPKLSTPPPPRSPTPLPKTPTPPPPKPATPPPTPLPSYISQFVGQQWFDQLFPNASSKSFPKPWSVTTFTATIINCIPSSVDSSDKTDMSEAVLLLHRQRDILWTESGKYCPMLFRCLLGPPPPNPSDPGDKRFILSILKYLFAANFMTPLFVALLMSFAISGEPDVVQVVLHYLASRGLVDAHNYFAELLSGWGLEDGESPYMASCAWLKDWAYQLEEAKLKRTKKASQKLEPRAYRPGGRARTKPSDQVNLKDQALEQCNPIEVIHFYLEQEHRQRLALMKPPTPVKAEETPVEDGRPRNTILKLPKIQRYGGIIRLGETHCSKCHPQRETTLALASSTLADKYITEHVKLNKSWLNIPLRPQVLDPFGPEESSTSQVEQICQQLQTLSAHKKTPKKAPVATWSPSVGYLKHYHSPLSLSKESKYFIIDSTYAAPPT